MISIDNLTITYYSPKKFFANKLEIKEGEITTIIGKNGSGKSTLLRAMAGMIPYEGSILIDGRECRSYSHRNRAKKIAYLPQVLKSVNMDVRTLIEHGRYPYMGNYRRLSDKDNEAV
ncbi:MAG: ABC transporter ATP-binding protein, partial [Lachnospiraceae bacterium]|nr:ABC transporter ATP-binding protein [Lachnospiraceae bacterium]